MAPWSDGDSWVETPLDLDLNSTGYLGFLNHFDPQVTIHKMGIQKFLLFGSLWGG
jgi:hypothetical protein